MDPIAAVFSLGHWEMRPALERLWRECFSEPEECIDLFFARQFRPENCAVFLVEGEPVAGLYLLEADLMLPRERYPVYYVYAAATLPSYRGKGLMGKLLSFVNGELAPLRNRAGTILLPASDTLYRFYEKQGYHTGFYIRSVEVSCDKIPEACRAVAVSGNPMADVRCRALTGQPYVRWSEEHLRYAALLNQKYGGYTVSVPGGYALCRPEDDVLRVLEFAAAGAGVSLLKEAVERSCGGRRRIVYRLAAGVPFYPGEGEICPFGMVSESLFPLFSKMQRGAYLGCPLD